MVWPSLIDKAHRLVTIDLFRQVTMEERVFDVELVYWPSARCGKVEHNVDGR